MKINKFSLMGYFLTVGWGVILGLDVVLFCSRQYKNAVILTIGIGCCLVACILLMLKEGKK